MRMPATTFSNFIFGVVIIFAGILSIWLISLFKKIFKTLKERYPEKYSELEHSSRGPFGITSFEYRRVSRQIMIRLFTNPQWFPEEMSAMIKSFKYFLIIYLTGTFFLVILFGIIQRG